MDPQSDVSNNNSTSNITAPTSQENQENNWPVPSQSDLIAFAQKHNMLDALKVFVKESRKKLLKQQTDEAYISKKGDHLFVKANYMDNAFKEESPLYQKRFAFTPFAIMNFVIVGVEVQDMVTGNQEIGIAAHRINLQSEVNKKLKAGTMSPAEINHTHVIDISNDVKAATTDAVKKAEAGFGVAADIYDTDVMLGDEMAEFKQDISDFSVEVYDAVESTLMQIQFKENWTAAKLPKAKLYVLERVIADDVRDPQKKQDLQAKFETLKSKYN